MREMTFPSLTDGSKGLMDIDKLNLKEITLNFIPLELTATKLYIIVRRIKFGGGV